MRCTHFTLEKLEFSEHCNKPHQNRRDNEKRKMSHTHIYIVPKIHRNNVNGQISSESACGCHLFLKNNNNNNNIEKPSTKHKNEEAKTNK